MGQLGDALGPSPAHQGLCNSLASLSASSLPPARLCLAVSFDYFSGLIRCRGFSGRRALALCRWLQWPALCAAGTLPSQGHRPCAICPCWGHGDEGDREGQMVLDLFGAI